MYNNGKKYYKISVVTPSYNQEKFLEETILSVINQNYPNIEYIIIDGGSTDDSIKIIKKYEAFLTYWKSEKDKGQSDAINKGFYKSTGEILCWLNSDDQLMKGTLHFVNEYFNNNEVVDCLYGNSINIDEKGNTLLKRHELMFDYNILVYTMNYIQQPSTFWRREVYEKVGGLDIELHYTMDHEYWLRMYRHGVHFQYVDKFLSLFRWHSKSKGIINSYKIVKEKNMIKMKYGIKIKNEFLRNWLYYILREFYRIKRQFIKVFVYGYYEMIPSNIYRYIYKRSK